MYYGWSREFLDRILRAEGLLTGTAFIVIKAAERFTNPTTAISRLWQTDFTYLKVTGWGWYYVSAVLATSHATSWLTSSASPWRRRT